MNADKKTRTGFVYPRSSAAGNAFAGFSGRLLALGNMFSYVLRSPKIGAAVY
jgi:hypothetical protein